MSVMIKDYQRQRILPRNDESNICLAAAVLFAILCVFNFCRYALPALSPLVNKTLPTNNGAPDVRLVDHII